MYSHFKAMNIKLEFGIPETATECV